MKKALGLALIVNLFFITTSFAELLIIANKELSANNLTSVQIKELLLGNSLLLNKLRVELVICRAFQEQLVSEYCNTTVEKFRKNWIKKIFSGGNLPPVVLNDCNEVNNYLKANKNAIGFVEIADREFKILHRNEKIAKKI